MSQLNWEIIWWQVERARLGIWISGVGSLMTTVITFGLMFHPKYSISYCSVTITALENWALFAKREDCPVLAHKCHFQEQLGFSKRSTDQGVLTKLTPT